MASLFGRGFNPLHLHYVTMKGLEPFIVFLAPPSPLRYNEGSRTFHCFFGPSISTTKRKGSTRTVESFSLEVRTRFERVYTVLQTVD